MNNTAFFILSLLNIVAELTELTYDLGVFTRKYVLPIVLYFGVFMYHYVTFVWDFLTSQTVTLRHIKTPFSTGFAY